VSNEETVLFVAATVEFECRGQSFLAGFPGGRPAAFDALKLRRREADLACERLLGQPAGDPQATDGLAIGELSHQRDSDAPRCTPGLDRDAPPAIPGRARRGLRRTRGTVCADGPAARLAPGSAPHTRNAPATP